MRDADESCPFCGTEQRAATSPSATAIVTFALVAATMLGTSACSTDPAPAMSGDTTTSAGTEPTATGETGSETEDPQTGDGDGDGDMTTDSSSASLSFYACTPTDDFWGPSECDPFGQDCPDGEKCVPYASADEGFDANKCVPITGAQAAGEPCVYGGIVEATDDCDESGHCWYIEEVDGETVGVCAPFCGGTADDPQCEPMTGCLIGFDGSVNLCLPSCDPLIQDCDDGRACALASNQFLCLDEGSAALGDECAGLGSCLGGSICVDASVVPGCAGASCCAELCDLTDVEFVCSEVGSECEPLFEGEVPGLDDVGACVVLPP